MQSLREYTFSFIWFNWFEIQFGLTCPLLFLDCVPDRADGWREGPFQDLPAVPVDVLAQRSQSANIHKCPGNKIYNLKRIINNLYLQCNCSHLKWVLLEATHLKAHLPKHHNDKLYQKAV